MPIKKIPTTRTVKKRGVVSKTRTVKLWDDTLAVMNQYQRKTPAGNPMPTIPAMVDFAVRSTLEETGALPTASDIITPAERRLINGLLRFHNSGLDHELIVFVLRQIGPTAEADVKEALAARKKNSSRPH